MLFPRGLVLAFALARHRRLRGATTSIGTTVVAARSFLHMWGCLLALWGLGVPAPAAEPADPLILPMQEVAGDHSAAAAPSRASSPTALAPPLDPTTAPGDTLLVNLMDEHLAYVRRLSQLNGLEIDPPAASAYHVFAEGGFYMVHSYFGSNPGFRTTFAKAPAPQETPFDYTVDFGPSVTLGVADADGRGTRASWWRLEEHAEFPPIVGLSANSGMMISSVGVPGLPGFTAPGRVARQLKIFNGVIALDNRVHVEVWDWEVFQSFRRDAWFFLASAGVRYGYLSENYRAIRVNSGVARSGSTTFNLLEDSDIVAEGRNFAGVGPTAVLEVHRRVGATGLSLYGTVRGSVLFGHQGAQAFQRTVERLQTQVGSAVPRTSTTSSIFQGGQGADETIPMGDFEVGVNWSVDYGPVLLFLQAGLVDQTWFGAGSATSGGGNTGFYGLRLTAGFHY